MEKDIKKDVDGTESSRRKFLKTAGKFALYTPPALMVMTQASTVSFANSCNNGFGNGDQCAPGNSLNNNNAENSMGGNPNHPGNPN
jgi:hypothetical protein